MTVILSTKDLKYKMVRRRTEKLMERYIGPYKIKKIVLSNAVELELPNTVKIHLVVNVSRIQKYVGQVKGQRKEQPTPVIIEEEKEWEVEKILNKQQIREKNKYLVRWKGFMAESDTQEERENLENAKETVEEFEKEYWRDIEEVNQQEREEGTFRRGELPGRFIARKLFRWLDKQYDQKYWGRLERNRKKWKRERRTLEEDEDEIDNMVDPYYEL